MSGRADGSGGFVCVFNGKRDGYQVPIALHETGLLDRLVTDFYAPPASATLLPRSLRSMRAEGLPRKKTRSVWSAFVPQAIGKALRLPALKPPMSAVYAWVDRRLANTAARLASSRCSGLYCYHLYVPSHVPDEACLIVFVFHPLAATERQILIDDAARFPEIAASAREQCESSLLQDIPIDWRRVDAVVCASQFTARSVIADGCAPDKIAVVPYGFTPPDSEPLRDAIAPRPPGAPARFLFVGQGMQRKGLHHLIRAWERWNGRSPVPARLEIVSYHLDPHIERMIRHPQIELVGYQSRDELDRRFAHADVFVLPSLIEGFGLVYLEALAHGCHVIGTDNTGLPDLPLGDRERTLVEAGSVEALAAALERCASDVCEGRYDRSAISSAAGRWTQADFRSRIGAHARTVLEASVRGAPGRPAERPARG